MNHQFNLIPADLKLKFQDKRIELIVEIALYTSLREAEILKIRREDMLKSDILWIECKGNNTRQVYFLPELREKLIAFIREDGLGETGWLFQSTQNPGQRMGASTLKMKWKQEQKRMGIDRPYRFHDLRHTAITRFWEATRDVMLTAVFAGHKNIQTTMRYTHPKPEDVWAKMKEIKWKQE